MVAEITTLDDLVLDVLVLCPGAGDALALDMLKATARKFAQTTNCLTEKIALVSVMDEDTYLLTPLTADCLVQRIEKVKYDDKGYSEEVKSYLLDSASSSLIFNEHHTPREGDLAFTATVSLLPKRHAGTSLPSWWIIKWQDGIAAGAAAAMLGMPGRPWYNPREAMNQKALYNRAVNQAHSDIAGEGTTRTQAWKF